MNNEWVNIKWGSPAKDNAYLVTLEGSSGVGGCIDILFYDTDHEYFYRNTPRGKAPVRDVVAWMELPSPFSQEG